MAPIRAWSIKGKRAYDKKPAQRGGNISMVGALKKSGMEVLYPYDGPIDSERFVDFLEHKLKPCLQSGDVVIMDNCRTHYASIVTAKAVDLSIPILFLPPYSPELNPIEEGWSVIKTKMRRKKARNISDYVDGIVEAKKCVTAKMAISLFNHANLCQNLC
jgi:transposase